MNSLPKSSAVVRLRSGDAVYGAGWSYCYQVVSAPFCRLHYLHSRSGVQLRPSDPPGYIAYQVTPLGGQRVEQLVVNLPKPDPDFS